MKKLLTARALTVATTIFGSLVGGANAATLVVPNDVYFAVTELGGLGDTKLGASTGAPVSTGIDGIYQWQDSETTEISPDNPITVSIFIRNFENSFGVSLFPLNGSEPVFDTMTGETYNTVAPFSTSIEIPGVLVPGEPGMFDRVEFDVSGVMMPGQIFSARISTASGEQHTLFQGEIIGTAIPEPSSAMLFSIAGLAIIGMRRRSNKAC